jgi:hypothetical protein
MVTILIALAVLMLVGAIPTWPHSRNWGYGPSVKIITAMALASLGATLVSSCSRDAQAMETRQIEEQYGVGGARSDTVATDDGVLKGTLVPITLANGQEGHLFIPQKNANGPHTVYIRDEQGLHPVQLRDGVTRDELIRSPGIVERRQEPAHPNQRSWEKQLLIVGGSAGAGTAIGALAGGKKGAGVGAAAGGVGGLIYDLMTRDKK